MGRASGAPWRRTSVLLTLTAALLVGYCGVLLWVGPTSARETFPFFNWQLFSKVPPEVNTSYGVRILEVDGVDVDPPRYFEASPDLFPSAKAPEASTAALAWGRHLRADRELESAVAQDLFEARFFASATTVRYEFVERRYDVIERVDCECYVSEEVLGEFEYG